LALGALFCLLPLLSGLLFRRALKRALDASAISAKAYCSFHELLATLLFASYMALLLLE
jgi:hypothetical protein